MSSSLSISDLVTRVTETSGVSESALSSILLVISLVAMTGAALGVLILCARALFRTPPPLPVSPSGRYRSTTILTAPVDSLVSPEAVVDSTAAGMPPVPSAFPLSPHDSPTVAGVPFAEIALSAEPHVDATEAMNPPVLSKASNALEDEEPETKRSRKGLAAAAVVEATLETSAWLEPPRTSEPAKGSHHLRAPSSSGLVATGPAIRNLENFQYGARRA